MASGRSMPLNQLIPLPPHARQRQDQLAFRWRERNCFCHLQRRDIYGEIAVLDGEERSADATAMTECEPQGFFAGPRGSRRSLYDPSQNPLPSAATDDRAGRERVVPASRVAGRQSIAAT